MPSSCPLLSCCCCRYTALKLLPMRKSQSGRCYHFGPRYNVEMEVVLPGSMTVAESHDIALELQHKVGWMGGWE